MNLGSLPINRALHPADYDHPELRSYVAVVRKAEQSFSMLGASYRKDHEHRTWEYANVLRQLDMLCHPLAGVDPTRPFAPRLRVVDTGSGGSTLPPILGSLGYQMLSTDSEAYGSVDVFLQSQWGRLGKVFEYEKCAVEDLGKSHPHEFDVTLCISVIEHLAADQFLPGFHSLIDATKPGGYLFMTSDFFASVEDGEKSIFRGIQHTLFTPEFTSSLPELLNHRVEFVGPQDFHYRGDFVHSYSFVNFALKVL